MLELRMSVELASSAGKVWEVVGNFNGLPNWHPWVTGSTLEPAAGGIGRRVIIDGGKAGPRELTERLISFDSTSRQYEYTIIAGPAPFKDYIGRFSITPNGTERCKFDYYARFLPASGFTETDATERISTFYEAAIKNLPTLFGR